MFPLANVFLDFNLPNATTWFYLSLILAVGLFFKFNRFFSIRNWDVLSLYLLVPGFLFLQEAERLRRGGGDAETAHSLRLYGYIWLMSGSLCFFARCLLDLTLVRRPALWPNLNLAGLACIAGALYVCMLPVAARRPVDLQMPSGKSTAAMNLIGEAGSQTVGQMQTLAGDEGRKGAVTRFWVERSLAMACHLAIAVALVLIGGIHFHSTTSGMAAATFYLLLPYTAYELGQAHHVVPTALLLWAIFCYRKPVLSGIMLGVAAGCFFFPALTLPIWLSFYRRRGAGRFLLFFAIAASLSLGLTGLVLWWDGALARSMQLVLSMPDWQPWKRTEESIWSSIHWAYRLPVFVLYLAFVILTSFWPSPKNLAHVISLSAAVLIGIQFWYADHGGVYVLWYLPLVVLMIFRPNLSDRFPPTPKPPPTWPFRATRALFGGMMRQIEPRQPAAKV
jgi:hypothetical protein